LAREANNIVTLGDSKHSGSAAVDLVNLLTAKTAKDLDLNMEMPKK